MPASTNPKAIATPISDFVDVDDAGGLRTQDTRTSTRAAMASRTVTAPTGPTRLKRWVANAAPNCTDTAPAPTRLTGGRAGRVTGRVYEAVAYAARRHATGSSRRMVRPSTTA